MSEFSEIVRAEAAKRDRIWDVHRRWQVLQETIAWAELQTTVRRNTKEGCLANQQRILVEMARYRESETRQSN
jgi:hypothetical protein